MCNVIDSYSLGEMVLQDVIMYSGKISMRGTEI